MANGGISEPTKPVSLQAHKKVLVTSPASGASGATGVQTSTYVVDIRCCKRSQCIALLAGGRRTSSSSPGQTTVSGLWELLQCALRSARSGPGCLRYIAPQRARQTSLLGRTLLQRGLRNNVCKRAIVSPHPQACSACWCWFFPTVSDCAYFQVLRHALCSVRQQLDEPDRGIAKRRRLVLRRRGCSQGGGCTGTVAQRSRAGGRHCPAGGRVCTGAG